ncbi:uncharacterized protein LOC143279955 [Babylonia areolata]|uniref:uncharacterized protein LOC143279955 n=1 Tax=Babylonia areolata TaxID=304850 RepID=UPI003FD42E61
MAQSWSEFVSGLLQSSARVDKAAVFSSSGQPLAASEGLQVSDKDGRAILRCLRDPARTLTRITLDETDFRCFQGNGEALVGMATSGSGRVLVARVTPGEEGAVVVVMGQATAKGSFLYEVQQSLVERTRRQRVSQGQALAGSSRGEGGQQVKQQQQQQQQPKKLILPPPAASSPVNQEQVLVQLHD